MSNTSDLVIKTNVNAKIKTIENRICNTDILVTKASYDTKIKDIGNKISNTITS